MVVGCKLDNCECARSSTNTADGGGCNWCEEGVCAERAYDVEIASADGVLFGNGLLMVRGAAQLLQYACTGEFIDTRRDCDGVEKKELLEKKRETQDLRVATHFCYLMQMMALKQRQRLPQA